MAEAELLQELDRWGQEVERFLGELVLESYRHDAGLKQELELAPIYQRFAHLFSWQAVERARALAAAAPACSTVRRRAELLLEFTVSGYLEEAVKEEVDRLGSLEAAGEVEVDGERIPYRAVAVRIANEPARQRRQRLDQARRAFTGQLNPLRESIRQRQQEQARALGFPSYADLYKALKGIDYDRLGRIVAGLLQRTEDAYRQRFGQALRQRVGVGLEQAEKHDVARLLRAEEFDGLFPSHRLVEALHCTLRGLGIEPSRQQHVHLDDEVRPAKSPRAFCAPVRVPTDIRLVILPQGGQDDYHALLHEAGHAQHFAHARPDLPAEFRYLGDNSVTECFAFLFDYLVSEPAWLERCLGLSPQRASAYVAMARLDRLYFLRRYAGKLLYELELHRARRAQGMAERYREILSQATGVRYDPVDYLADVDDAFYVAEYLRAWALEVLLRERLRTRFGRSWFASRKAGELLQSLWAQGQQPTGEELARQLGFADVDFEPLMAELLADGAPGVQG